MDDSKLIELVREHQSLYNTKHRQYKDSNVRDNVWMEIAELLKQPVDECKNRWKNIRDTFMRRKRNNKLPTGSARRKLRKWHLEEHLVFLSHVECERESLTNIATLETQDDNINYESQQTEYVELEGDPYDPENEASGTFTETNITDANITECIREEQGKEENETEAKSAYKRKNSTKKSVDDIVELFKKNSNDRAKLLSTVLAKQPEEQHQIDTFFKSMAMSVKKMSPENQIRAKMQICQIVGQLELDEICSLSSSASASISSVSYDLHTLRLTSHTSFTSHTSPASLPDNEMQVMTNVSGHNFP